ncbi:MAG: hypothetical protein VW491_09195 [Gammaproteobacteria bacterium]
MDPGKDFCLYTNAEIVELVLGTTTTTAKPKYVVSIPEMLAAIGTSEIGKKRDDTDAPMAFDEAPVFYKSDTIVYSITLDTSLQSNSLRPPAAGITATKIGNTLTFSVATSYTKPTATLQIGSNTIQFKIETFNIGSGADKTPQAYATTGAHCPSACPANCPIDYDQRLTLTVDCATSSRCGGIDCASIQTEWNADKLIDYNVTGACGKPSRQRRQASETVKYDLNMPPPFDPRALANFVELVNDGTSSLGRGITAYAPSAAAEQDDDSHTTEIAVGLSVGIPALIISGVVVYHCKKSTKQTPDAFEMVDLMGDSNL